MPFTHNLDPIIFSLGPLAVRWYSLVYVFGFLLGYWILVRSQTLKRKEAEECISWLVLGTVIGARLFYVLVYNPSYYLAEPLRVFALWEGGLSFHGGLLGAALAAWLWCRRRNVRFYTLADALALPLSLALIFGRLANFVNGELVGTLSQSSFCVNYPGIEGCRHPSQLYEAGKNLLVFLILLPLWLKRKALREGTLFWLFVFLYGFGRFLTDYWRAPDPTDPLLGGLLLGQWFSLCMALVAIVLLWQRFAQRPEKKQR